MLCNKMAPMLFPSESMTKIATTYTPGLLRATDGSVDSSQSTYSTSDYIELDKMLNYVYRTDSDMYGTTLYAIVCLYDSKKTPIESLPMNLPSIQNAFYIPLYINRNVSYIRVSIRSRNEGTSGLYSFVPENFFHTWKQALSNIQTNRNDIKTIQDNKILPFAFNNWTALESGSYENGLLRGGDGSVDTNQNTYRTSDYIDLSNELINNYKVIAISTSLMKLHPMYAVVAFYDNQKVFISSINCKQYALGTGKFIVNVPENTRYARISLHENQVSNQQYGLFSAPILSLEDFLQNLTSDIDSQSEKLDTSFWDDFVDYDNIIEATYYYNQRNDDVHRIGDNGYIMMVIDVTEDMVGKVMYCNTYPSIYSPGLRFYNSHPEDDNFSRSELISTYFETNESSSVKASGAVIIPKNAKAAVLQARVSRTSITSAIYPKERLLGILSASLSHRNYLSPNSDSVYRARQLEATKVVEDEVTEVYPAFENYVDYNNLVGTYYMGKRFDDTGLISDRSFSCIVIKDIGDNRFLNVRCTASQYVPGIRLYNTDVDEDLTTANQIGAFLYNDSQSPISYNVQVRIPGGTKTIVVQARYNDDTIIKEHLAASFTSAKSVSQNDLDEALDVIQNRTNTYWTGKNIWWCGTSIPAGGDYNVDNQNSYPLMVGKLLGAARVFNEAVGSSQAAGSMVVESYEPYIKRMGHTIAQKIQIINDLYTINDSEQTVTAGPRSMGITGYPTITTYSDAQAWRHKVLQYSYEVKLVAKYLLSDETEHDNYLQDRLGTVYGPVVGYEPDSWKYQGNIDLFVMDHSNNDSTAGSYDDINSEDITTYVGALNTYVRLIQKYKPRATVVFISNYTDSPNGVIQTESDIAGNWHMPFCNLLGKIPVGGRQFRITVRGYWDEDRFWHDEGFTWTDDGSEYVTNLNLSGMALRIKGDGSLNQVKSRINPTLGSDGKWYWDAYPNDIWMYDGLHPHSDKTGRCLKLYAQTIAAFLKHVGDGIY